MPRPSSLRNPVAHEPLFRAFVLAKAYAIMRSPEIQKASFKICPELRKGLRGAARARAYMHVGHASHHTVCAHPDAQKLPKNFIYGLLFHELGHVATGASEKNADLWVFQKLGIVIQYFSSQKLEWVSDEVLEKIGA